MSLVSEIKNIKAAVKELRRFGLVVGAVFIALGFLFLFLGRGSYIVFLVIGTLLVFFGALAPTVLFWPYRLWMGLAIVMSWIMSRLILTILFYIIIVPIGFLARAAGKDFLNLKRSKVHFYSYWHKRGGETMPPERYEKQF